MAKNLPIKYRSESAVKRALHIDSFRNLSKDKVIKFVSMIPYMDKEVALAIINQFPEFVGFGKVVVDFYSNIFNDILEKNKELDLATIHSYQAILDVLSKKLSDENISDAERQAITTDMIAVADKIAAVNLQSKKFYNEVLSKIVSSVGLIVVGVCTAIGVNSYLGNTGDLPEIEPDEDSKRLE